LHHNHFDVLLKQARAQSGSWRLSKTKTAKQKEPGGRAQAPGFTMPQDNPLQRLIHKNLIYTVRTIVDSELFKHIYVRDTRDGREFDAMDDGIGACAYTVSGVLALHGLIDHPHATVAKTIARMQDAGWVKTNTPKPGDVVQWAALNDNMHMAFFIGDDQVIGNSTQNRVPKQYALTLPDGRKPIAYYTHPSLAQ
jgi:hypothetical protein